MNIEKSAREYRGYFFIGKNRHGKVYRLIANRSRGIHEYRAVNF